MYGFFPFQGHPVNRWCPSCRKAWPAERAVCPDCLVDLVADPDATVPCRHCGRDWPATMVSCPNCLSELRTDPAAAVEGMAQILARGGHLPRAAGTVPFADGPACTLLRLAGRGPLVYVGADELIQATVAGSEGRAVPPLTCNDAGDVLFHLVPYEPVEGAVVAIGADGAALATFLRSEGDIDVRDETSAPVARLVGRGDGFELVETGGGTLAAVGSVDFHINGWIDDQWWLQPAGRLPMGRLAAVAMVLAAKVLLGRPWPTQVPAAPDEDPIGDHNRWLMGN